MDIYADDTTVHERNSKIQDNLVADLSFYRALTNQWGEKLTGHIQG